MAKTAQIQTNLLGRAVVVKDIESPNIRTSWRNARCEIVNVYLDKDGNPRYTLKYMFPNEVQATTPQDLEASQKNTAENSGTLWDTTDFAFKVIR